MRGRDNQKAILQQRHRPNKDKRGIGAAPMKEARTHHAQDEMVCSSCGGGWKRQATKFWACTGTAAKAYHERKETDQLVEISGAPWRLQLNNGTITWVPQDNDAEMDKDGQVYGCEVGEAPPCPIITTLEDEQELTLADQIPQQLRVHIRQGILEHKIEEREVQNLAMTALRKANLENIMQQVMQGKPADLTQSLMQNHDKEEEVRAANKRLQAQGQTNMKKFSVITPGEPRVWPKDLSNMVEQGYFNPMKDTPLRHSDWREDTLQRYKSVKALLNQDGRMDNEPAQTMSLQGWELPGPDCGHCTARCSSSCSSLTQGKIKETGSFCPS